MLQNKNTLKNNCNYCESPHGVVYIYMFTTKLYITADLSCLFNAASQSHASAAAAGSVYTRQFTSLRHTLSVLLQQNACKFKYKFKGHIFVLYKRVQQQLEM